MSVKNIVYNALANPHRRAALRQLRDFESKLLSPRSRFALPFVYRGHGHFKTIQPKQNPLEIEELFELACDLEPQRVLEIGTARGGTLYLWTQAARPDATIVSVDLPGGPFGGAYCMYRTPFYQSFAREGQRLHLERADSHDPQTVRQVTDLFANQPADFLFIDGDHTYEGVKADFEQYGPLVRPGGLIGLHDVLPRDDAPAIEVHRLWDQIQSKYDGREIVGPEGSGRKIGIGVVRVPDAGINVAP